MNSTKYIEGLNMRKIIYVCLICVLLVFCVACNGDNQQMDRLPRKVEESEIEKRFKALYEAFKYGAPPHAGMAPGIDRIIMLLQDEPNLREVQAFPMSVSGQDMMMGCPSELTEQQLREVHIKIR